MGSSAWAEFDTRYSGPPELNILTAVGNPTRATIDVTWAPTTLTDAEFGGVEVAVETTDGTEQCKIVYFAGSPIVTSYPYPYPVSGKEYRILVRQVRNVGADQVEGRWSRALATVAYKPYSWIKTVEGDPLANAVAFQPMGGRSRSPIREAPVKRHFPWGARTPVHLVGEERVRKGELAFDFYSDASLQVPLSRDRYISVKTHVDARSTICLLMQHPEAEKIFAAIVGDVLFSEGPDDSQVVEFHWQETSYEEDYYKRQGLA